jgi:16S rRNA (uracil1498-N3)-methyltransferase
MTGPRFYLDQDLGPEQHVTLPDPIAHHAVRVLRMRDGAVATLFNGRGGEFECRLRIDGSRVSARLERHHAIERESPLSLTLVQSWVATDKLDLIVEKSVELGVASIVLVPAVRSVVHLDDARRARRLLRLKEIVVAACCQCGRNRLPEIGAAGTLHEGLAAALEGGATGLLLDLQGAEPFAQAIRGAGPFALAIGPEGGFSEDECAFGRRLGYRPVRFGPRTLRTETAGLAVLAALQALGGDLR